MSDPFDTGADTHFGFVDAQLPDWRDAEDVADPDDEQIKTPGDVLAVLGFDPAEAEAEQFAEPPDATDPVADRLTDLATAETMKVVSRAEKAIASALKKKHLI